MEKQKNKKKEIFKNILYITLFLSLIFVGSLSDTNYHSEDLSLWGYVKSVVLWPIKKIIKWII